MSKNKFSLKPLALAISGVLLVGNVGIAVASDHEGGGSSGGCGGGSSSNCNPNNLKVTPNTALAFGNVHVGSVKQISYVVKNSSNSSITAKVSLLNSPLDSRLSDNGVTTGDIAYAKGETSKSIIFNPTSAGLLSETLNFKVCNTLVDSLSVTGAAYDYAVGALSSNTITLAAQRVGDTAAYKALSLSNTAANSSYSEKLAASITSSSPVLSSGSVSGLAGGSSDNTSLKVGVSTVTSGHISGSATLNLKSKAGVTDLPDTDLASKTVNVSGNVYQTAQATVAPNPVGFGIVHVGDDVSKNINVKNTANGADGYTDSLTGSVSSSSSAFTTTTPTALANGLGKGQSTDVSVKLDTSSNGQFSGNAALALKSHNSEMSDVNLGTQSVALSAQVNNYAVADLEQTAGDTGGFSSTNIATHEYQYDFGSIDQGGTYSASFDLFNAVTGFADYLSSSSIEQSGSGFSFSNLNLFSNLGAGERSGIFSVNFATASLVAGSDYLTTLIFHSLGSNASGWNQAVNDVTLIIKGHVNALLPISNINGSNAVPVPGAVWLFGSGIMGLLAKKRYKKLA